jgi:hypothetical protein
VKSASSPEAAEILAQMEAEETDVAAEDEE